MARTVLGEIPIVAGDRGRTERPMHGSCQVMLRPEQLRDQARGRRRRTTARVLEVQYLGHDALAHLRVDDASAPVLLARIPGELSLEPGQAVWIDGDRRGARVARGVA